MSAEMARLVLHELAQLGVTPSGASVDSRRVQSGEVFFAWPGYLSDGRTHIKCALERGAAAILYENSDGRVMPELSVPAVGVADLKALAGHIGHAIYGAPSSKLWMLGVTGTNGKTSVSHWLASALGALGERCGVVGTLGSGYPGKIGGDALNTTPDVLSLHRLLRGFVNDGAAAVAMEVSSIGLEQGRVIGVEFDTAVFTNLTRDHLDYHADMAAYGSAKAKLFAMPGIQRVVINFDDEFGRQLLSNISATGTDCIAYSLQASANAGKAELLRGQLLPSQAFGTHLRVFWQGRQGDIRARVLGRFNAQNLLAVVGSLLSKGVDLESALAVASSLEAPRGRMELLGGVGEPLVVIDYAHSPDALCKILETCRETASSRGGKLICVFGCGGDRDPGKRPMMGEVAANHADRVLVTSDNPRSEDPESIIADILSGAGASAEPVVDRAEAIARAIVEARPDDVIVLAGKGHETYQEIKGCRMSFSDAEHAAKALAEWVGAQGDAA